MDRWAAKRSVTERRSELLEQKIFIAAFAMRKLFEAKKLSTTHESHSVRCTKFTARADAKITRLNHHRFEDHYDLSRPVAKNINLRDLLDLIVHSLSFGEVLNDDLTVGGFFVTSDKKRRFLWLVNLAAFTALTRRIGKDRPSVSVFQYDEAKADYVVWNGDGEPPARFRTNTRRRGNA